MLKERLSVMHEAEQGNAQGLVSKLYYGSQEGTGQMPAAISWHSSIQLMACTNTFQEMGANRAWWKLAYFIKFLKG